MFCRNCGNKVDENAYICVNCGIILDNKGSNKSTIRKKKKNNDNQVCGIISIITGIYAFILSIYYLTGYISNVGMYTGIYDKIIFAYNYTHVAIFFTIISFVFALSFKNKKINKIGLVLSLISAFLIITEFMVAIIY